MLLKPSPVSTAKFMYDKTDRVFWADMSDLGREFSLGRVYDDSCDEGFTLVSQWTGEEIVFVLDHVLRDGEGDVLRWEFRPVPNPKVKKFFRLYLIND